MRGLVTIGIPTYRFNIHAGVGLMLHKLGMSLTDRMFVPLGVRFTSTPLLSNARNTLVSQALALNADYLLMVDSDTYYLTVGDIVDMLLTMHEGELPVIAAPYKLRTGEMSIYPWNETRRGTVFECESAATGFMAINLKLLKKNWPKPPWFTVLDHEGTLDVTGEDEWFCNEVRGRGGVIWCDARFEPMHSMGDETKWTGL